MQAKLCSILMILLMSLSAMTIPDGLTETNQDISQDVEQNDTEKLTDAQQDALTRARQATTASWEFDTTAFAMYFDGEGEYEDENGNIVQVDYFLPCIQAGGWRQGSGSTTSQGFTPQDLMSYPWGAGPRYDDAGDNNCHSWDGGTAGAQFPGGYLVDNFVTATGDGSTDAVPEHNSHDLGRYWNQNYQQSHMDQHAPHTLDGVLDSDNMIDFDIDNSGAAYVVGSWDGDRMVFPNVIGTHVYLDNSGKDSSGVTLNDPHDPEFNTNHEKDIYVAKMDVNGVWLWATSIRHHGLETASSIAVSRDGGVFIGGTIQVVDYPDFAYDSNAYFDDAPLSSGGGTSSLTLSTTDFEPYGFVAKLSTNGAFQKVKRIESQTSFSSVSDIAVEYRGSDLVYFIGKMGACQGQGCPVADSYMIGTIDTVTSLGGNPWTVTWTQFMDENITLTEIEANSNGAFVTGFTDESAGTIDSWTIAEDSIVIAKVNKATTTSTPAWDWVQYCDPSSDSMNWFDDNGGWEDTYNPSWGLDVSNSTVGLIVEPGSSCGNLDDQWYGFQVVALSESDGSWMWTNGDKKDTSNLPAHLQYSNNAHASDLAITTNGDMVISVNLHKIIRVNGNTFMPSGMNPDMLLLRLDDDTGVNIWNHLEKNPECDLQTYELSLANYNTCEDYRRGGADARRIVVQGLDDIYLSGMVYGKEIYLHDGLPEHCDYAFAEPGIVVPGTGGNTNSMVWLQDDLQGYQGSGNHYYTKCQTSTHWWTSQGLTAPSIQNREIFFPDHGTQWHGGDAYFAKFDACPKVVQTGGAVLAEIDTRTAGRTDQYVMPVGEPSNVDPNRHDCGIEYPDPDPGNTDVWGDIQEDPDDALEPYIPIVNPNPPIHPCGCQSEDSLANLTDLKSVHIMEITAPVSGGSPQNVGATYAGFYHIEYDFATQTQANGILSNTQTDAQMMAMNNGDCDLRTSPRECYDFYTSDEYGIYDAYGDFIAIRAFHHYSSDAINLDAVWLEMNNGDVFYADEIVYFNHGINPAGTSLETEILGPPSNSLSVVPISNPTGYTRLGYDFTTIVLCFDTLPDPVEEEPINDDSDSMLPGISLTATICVALLGAAFTRRDKH